MAAGKKTGGRTAGTPNRASAEQAQAVAASGLTPLEYMLQVMRDPDALVDRRDDMAKASAPYVHPKLAAVEHTGKNGGPILLSQITDEELAAIATGRSAGTSPKA